MIGRGCIYDDLQIEEIRELWVLGDEVLRIREGLRTIIVVVSYNPKEALYLTDRLIVLSTCPCAPAAALIPSPVLTIW